MLKYSVLPFDQRERPWRVTAVYNDKLNLEVI